MQGSLFTQYFLLTGITETTTWRSLDDPNVAAFRTLIREVFSEFPTAGTPNEAVTERNLIDPVLKALGWHDFLPGQSASRARSDVPDYLLFKDATAKAAANGERDDVARYRHGLAIVEAKRWQRPLDRGREPDLFDDGVPSTQMLRYLSRAEVASDRRIQWGILTNGRHWRLYFQGARSRAEEFLELDLPLLVGAPGVEPDLLSPRPEERAHFLKVFLLLFRREAFLGTEESNRTFHQLALDEGRHWEARVTKDLSHVVIDKVYPGLIRTLAAKDPAAPSPLTPAYLEEARLAALTFLYRLLFVFYAEDRNLLPVKDSRYDDYALRRVREDVRRRADINDVFSASQGRYYDDLKGLFAAIHSGDESLSLPPYNGGLFDPVHHPILARTTIPDAKFAPIVDALSRREEGSEYKWINYRDLSVQHLGWIYERLLEFAAVLDPEAESGIAIRPNIFARKGSGGYYTHQDLVTLIIRRTVGPLVDERRDAFHARAEELRSSRAPRAERLAKLAHEDAASAILELKVCDPAMGSGHFLVSLVDYLADSVLEAVAEAQETVDWASRDAPYHSPLVTRIETIRDRILAQAEAGHWAIDSEQLDDRHIVRRMILKRVIYGVDKNPMAVELAKVSLWLHTFTVGAPLSFLDHHLHCGDSLFGEWIGPAMREMRDRYALLLNPYVQQASNVLRLMQHIEEMTDADITEVRQSATEFSRVVADTEPLRRFLDFRQALRWLGIHDFGTRNVPAELRELLSGALGDPFRIVAGEISLIDGDDSAVDQGDMFGNHESKLAKRRRLTRETRAATQTLIEKARDVSNRERFLHWEIAFPGVWQDWESAQPAGGFDAVIGNPPWDRIKMQEVEWFATRRPEIAHAQHASDRKRMIEQLKSRRDSLWEDYQRAAQTAESAAEVARESADYPLLSTGDINLYSLFVERSHRLIEPAGIVGLLTPSGIAADLGASRFFRDISTTGRLASLIDFENRRGFFPDVDSRFKFCVFIAGGKERRFPAAECAFYLHSVGDLDDPERRFALSAEDFARINPNTGTAPVFRTRRDAALTSAIFSRVPVLVDRRTDPPAQVWPVQYVRMFDMTNDANLFKTQPELEADGFYPVGGNRLRRGNEEYVPLYVGRMIGQFNHRAANVEVNPDNLHNPALSDNVESEHLSDPSFCVAPQFWVDAAAVDWPSDLGWLVGFRDIARGTDVRTLIASAVPFSAVGNTLPLLIPDQYDQAATAAYRRDVPMLLANLNAFVLDFVTRQKVQSTHLNWYIVEQLPILPASHYERHFGHTNATDVIRREVLHLTYTAHDMAAFARDLGYDGPPFVWDEVDRRHRRARLDALFFHLYEISRQDAAYILDTFPIVKREDEAAFGRYLTRDLILAYMNAVAAGDFDAVVSV